MKFMLFNTYDLMMARLAIDASKLGYPLGETLYPLASTKHSDGIKYAACIEPVPSTATADTGYVKRIVDVENEILSQAERDSLVDEQYLIDNGYYDEPTA